MQKVIIYSTTTCPHCKSLKDYLEEKNIDFTERLVDQDDEAKEEMMEVSGGFLGVPFLVITKDDESKETIVGFDKNKINQVLGLD
ncbi:glutaredoxin family protein [Patescibacteria group bacterium]|nr:glutaredoxin family protein [Patescibacteria group bacterium]